MDKDDDKIEKLKQALYSREGVSRSAHILDLNKHDQMLEDDWKKEEEVVPEPVNYVEDDQKKSSILKKIFLVSLVFFVISVGAAAYIFLNGTNVISAEKIDISIVGPVTSPGGEELSLDINITNQNSIPIELADLIIKYPEGSRSIFDKKTELSDERLAVGSISPGETVRKTIKSVPFGEEGNNIETFFDLEYRVPGSTSVFNKNFSHSVVLGSSPVTLKLEGLNEVNSNQELNLTLTLNSNSSEILKDILIKADFPFGFEITEVDPLPLEKRLVWRLGDIEPLGKRVIKVKGKVIGEQGQSRVFKFSAGTESSKTLGTLSATFMEVNHKVAIKKPFLAAQIAIDTTSEGEFVTQSGENLNMSIVYQNNLSVPITDLVIESRIKGPIVNKRTINAQGGYYKSSEDLLTWSRFEKDDLDTLLPGEKGEVRMNFKSFEGTSGEASSMRNPEVIVDVSVRGKRLSEKDVPEEIVSTVERKIKIASDLRLSARGLHSTGSIENQGTIPPKVDQKTDYGIVWTVTNNFNEIEGAKVKAVLPSFVNWTNVTTPTSEKMTYNSDSREVTWDLGRVLPGGSTPSVRQVSFQVSITPSLGQIGDAPMLVNDATLTGKDTFTNTVISDTVKAITTAISTDPVYEFGDDRVVE